MAVAVTSCGQNRVTPEPLDGVIVFVDEDQRSFTVDDTPEDDSAVGNSFVLPPIWEDRDGVGLEGIPDCLEVGSSVTVGVVRTEPTDMAPGVELATWLICR